MSLFGNELKLGNELKRKFTLSSFNCEGNGFSIQESHLFLTNLTYEEMETTIFKRINEAVVNDCASVKFRIRKTF